MQVPIQGIHGAKRSIPCVFQGMEGRRAILEAGEALAVSTALSIEYEDKLFLGEVVICTAQSPGLYRLEIKVEQILTGLQSLMNLRARLLGEGVPKQLGMMPVGARN
jgi:hypothetical protein